MVTVSSSVDKAIVVKASDSGLWDASQESLLRASFPASKLFIFRGISVEDASEPANVGLLNCELVKVPRNWDRIEDVPQKLTKLDKNSLIKIPHSSRVASLAQLEQLAHDRKETTLVHHVCVPRLGLSYPERLVAKTMRAFMNYDIPEWKRFSAALITGGLATGIVAWGYSGNAFAIVGVAFIGVGGSLLSWAGVKITWLRVERGLRRLAFPPYPPEIAKGSENPHSLFGESKRY